MLSEHCTQIRVGVIEILPVIGGIMMETLQRTHVSIFKQFDFFFGFGTASKSSAETM